MERMRESTRNGGGEAAGKTPENNTMAPASHGNTQGNTMAPSSRESSKPAAPAPDGTKLGTAPTATPAPSAWARLREALTKPRGAEARAIERQANPPSAIELANNPNPNAAALPSDPSNPDASPGRFTRWWRRHRPSDRALGWIAPLIVSLLGGFVRFFRLGSPRFLVFDETYYVKAAWTMLQTGEAREWPKFGVTHRHPHA